MPVDWNSESPVITGMVQARELSDAITAPANVSLIETFIGSAGWNQNDDQQITLEILLSDDGVNFRPVAKAVWSASGVWHALHDSTTRSQPVGPVLSWERYAAGAAPTHYKIAASSENGIAMTVRARAV